MYTRIFVGNTAVVALVAISWFRPAVAVAQPPDSEAGEVAGFVGGAFGMGTKPTAAGSAGVAISRYAMALFDTSFLPMGQHTIQPWPPRSTVDRSYLLDFGVDFHIRIPIKERWAPYGIVGTGLLWNMVRQHTVNSQGQTMVNHYDQFNGALHTGAGLRYYISPNWGIRPEVKVVVSKQTYVQAMVGIFYVTPPNWP